ncbi:Pentatricopeptide repeat-containing protein [Camellia lanceoleosa]|uniref:Pentatricopeptide repeat-containing protein n=1 Tax=Camellia lanceoleosa TaxID=1840588 RepID=A0ACC0J4U4_9ERIC|nr:Pentatricopeptide repeat-containing protein [Camellia lanceoleosa]
METASTGPPRPRLPTPPTTTQPNTDKIKQKLLHKGVYPTPKIIHTLRKKHLQKSLRKSNRRLASQSQSQSQPPLTDSQKQSIAEESHFQTLKAEYKNFTKSISTKTRDDDGVLPMVGKPWERLERVQFRELSSSSREYCGDKLKSQPLRELSEILQKGWLLDNDVVFEQGSLKGERKIWAPPKRSEAEAIRFLVDKLSGMELSMKDWKLSWMMKKSGLQFTEGQLLKIVEGLGDKGQWRHALSVVEWVYSSKEHRHYKSRFVYTKLLAVLGKARRPREALQIFDLMREDCQIYPDMPAYHSASVTLGQAGFLKELLKIIECMGEKPAKRIKNMRHRNWDPILQPDVVVFNAVLNACVPTHQWKGVSWVFGQLRKNGLKPNGATYGLAMEVMLRSGKYDRVHEFFEKMRRSGEAPKALTYKVLVRAFWEEGKVDEAVKVVRDMEQRGVFGIACVYYELACCLSNNGRWQEAMLEVEKLKKLPRTKPLEVTFTGMIMSSMDGGRVHDCISIFQHIKDHFVLDIGIINAILKVYGRNDMFSEAKELFEDIKKAKSDSNHSLDGFGSSLIPDAYTYSTMLETSASALQWEYFEYVYREMALSGYQLDHSKHTFLLVEASRAGKFYLLEHAFDTMLEAGEIPHPSVFTELICQAIIQHDFERVVGIINTMAHAPFQVSEKQWTDLFECNGDRISEESLKELLDALSNFDLPMEATVSNLSKSLLCFCRSDNWKEISSPVAFDDVSVDQSPLVGNNGRLGCDENINVHNFSANTVEDDSDSDDKFSVGQSSNTEDDADSEMFWFSSYDSNEDRKANLFTSLEDLTVDMISDASSVGCDDKFSNHIKYGNLDNEEVELDVPTGKVGNCGNLPSAHEILESWKESRKKDGMFCPYQFGGK